MGNAMTSARWALPLLVCLASSPVQAAERYAIVVSGASGGLKYLETYDRWRTTLTEALVEKLGFSRDHVTVLSGEAESDRDRATQENVTRAVLSVGERLKSDDLLMVVLIGHGTFDGQSAKFNLVGPDFDAHEWAQLVEMLPGHLIFVDTSGASYPFLEAISGPNRIIITATDSAGQRFDTIFPQFFAEALDQVVADSDKNGRVSIWEAFAYASQAVAHWYEERGQLATERAVIDDNGDHVGKDAPTPGADGTVARGVYLDPDPAGTGADTILAGLHQRRVALEAEIEALKARKESMRPEDYAAEFEKLAVELARTARVIRSRS
jgi:hypothetical protein